MLILQHIVEFCVDCRICYCSHFVTNKIHKYPVEKQNINKLLVIFDQGGIEKQGGGRKNEQPQRRGGGRKKQNNPRGDQNTEQHFEDEIFLARFLHSLESLLYHIFICIYSGTSLIQPSLGLWESAVIVRWLHIRIFIANDQ